MNVATYIQAVFVISVCQHAFSPLCPSQKPVNFWFATGGAGFCVSRGLALKMSPWAR